MRQLKDSPAGDVDLHIIARQAYVLVHSCDVTDSYFQGQEIDRILLYPKGRRCWWSELASRVPVAQKMQDEDCGFDRRTRVNSVSFSLTKLSYLVYASK